MPVRAKGAGAIRLTVQDGLAEIALDRPWARNAVSTSMVADLRGIVDQLERSDLAAVLLCGVGPVFCAGSDLAEVREGVRQPQAALALCQEMTELLRRFTALPMLRLAAVEGAALGGGAELMLCCQRVLAGRSAQVGFVQAALGLSPGWGGGARLVERVGPRRTALLLAESRRLSAPEAHEAGLLDELVDDGEAAAQARGWLTALPAWGRPEVLRAAVSVAQGQGQAAPEQAAFSTLWGGIAHQAALAALSQGRRG